MTWMDGVIIAVVLLIIAGAFGLLMRDHRRGKGCQGCHHYGHCHTHDEQVEDCPYPEIYSKRKK